MGTIVLKFGGSSVRGREELLRFAEIVRSFRERGEQVVAVLSAQGDTTSRLLLRARELLPLPPARELDVLLSTGETASAALGAIALQRGGIDAAALCGWQVPMQTDDGFGTAAIRRVGTARLRRELAAGRVPVVAGFQGLTEENDITTLGRGGSDTSATAIAAALHADRCLIYTDVDGVFTADPRICPTARRLSRISYDHMLRLARCGAKVLHDRAAEYAMRERVPLTILSCEKNAVGTAVVSDADCGAVTGAALLCRGERSVISAVGAALPSPQLRDAALAALSSAGIAVLGLEEAEQCLSITVSCEDARTALQKMHDALLK